MLRVWGLIPPKCIENHAIILSVHLSIELLLWSFLFIRFFSLYMSIGSSVHPSSLKFFVVFVIYLFVSFVCLVSFVCVVGWGFVIGISLADFGFLRAIMFWRGIHSIGGGGWYSLYSALIWRIFLSHLLRFLNVLFVFPSLRGFYRYHRNMEIVESFSTAISTYQPINYAISCPYKDIFCFMSNHTCEIFLFLCCCCCHGDATFLFTFSLFAEFLFIFFHHL